MPYKMEPPALGVDISEFNGSVDIAGLKGRVDFVIIRCGYGRNTAAQDDREYAANVRKCEEAGMPYGVYLYSYAKSVSAAGSEAAHVIRLLDGRKPLYGVWYDVEDSSLPTGEGLIDNCVAWCEAIRAAGLYPGVYSSLAWWNSRLNSPRLNGYDRWIAYWGSPLIFDREYGMWQFTNKGEIDGRTYDMNRAYRDYPAIIRGMEETEMTREEIAALARQEAQAVYNENESRYKLIADLPEWAIAAAEKVYGELGLAGTGGVGENTRVNASYTYARVLTVIAKLLEKQDGE